jgi:predicted transcriptional regulator
MTSADKQSKVLSFPKTGGKRAASHERIWGKAVIQHGYAGIPSVLIQAQSRLGISPLQMNIIIQLLDYWRDHDRRPFPSKKDLARRIGVTDKTIQNNIRALERAGLIRRELRRAAAGDWNSNIYHLDGLVERIQKIEPDFAEAKEKRREAMRRAETPVGRRKPEPRK